MMIWIGIGIGSPLLGFVSDFFNSRRLALGCSAVFGLVATVFLMYVPNVSLTAMYGVLLLFGIGAGGQTVSFAVVKDNNPSELVGTASGFNNLAVLIGGAIFQPVVGFVLKHSSDWIMISGVTYYTIESFNRALIVIPICFLLSLLLTLFVLPETHPYHVAAPSPQTPTR